MIDRLNEDLDTIRQAGNYRQVKYITPLSPTRIIHAGRTCLNLCSNSYLSLHTHPDVITAAQAASATYGAGTCSSRSVSGSFDLYETLEREIAGFKGYGGALIFSNGYMANMGIISTLTRDGDVIFSDQLNHSSIIDSARLSRARKVIYRHLDMEDLQKKLAREKRATRKFIISESVFSMDGDIAPLDRLHGLKEQYEAYLIVDEAHATGVFGEKGRGVEEIFDLSGKMDVQMGTFGKSLGSFGAFVLSNEVVLEYLINRARTFMYTTALPASVLAASLAALRVLRSDASVKAMLWSNIEYMRKGLTEAGFDLGESRGPIVPIIVGEDNRTVRMQQKLLDDGIFLQAIRPPTVPAGTSRLRLTVVAALAKDDMDEAIRAIVRAGQYAGIV
jgi:8-amino-7-oxononanoate synthase